ncbi:MAG TPA: hypothetical protein VFQ54_01455 [Thermomicrobiales bacterium]|nr:hypothetical protein [Thermomicrobiales bacterium]
MVTLARFRPDIDEFPSGVTVDCRWRHEYPEPGSHHAATTRSVAGGKLTPGAGGNHAVGKDLSQVTGERPGSYLSIGSVCVEHRIDQTRHQPAPDKVALVADIVTRVDRVLMTLDSP